MSDTKHTPGPWETRPVGPRMRATILRSCMDRLIVPSGGPTIAILPDGRQDIQAANARLMAAAPDLLEALEYAVQPYGVEGPHVPLWVLKARAAIAKAKG